MQDVMLQMGAVQFMVPGMAVQALTRTQHFRYASNQPVSGAPIHQYLGEGEHSIRIQGVVYAQFLFPINWLAEAGLAPNSLRGGIAALRDAPNVFIKNLRGRFTETVRGIHQSPIDELEALASSGRPQDIFSGDGRRLGAFYIERIERSGDTWTARGGLYKQTFSLELKRKREERDNGTRIS